MTRKFFVSYDYRDRSRLQNALEQLRKRKVLSADDIILVDTKSISEGESFRDTAREAIGAADTVLVLWSPAAAESKWVNYEIAMADALGKHLVIVAPRGMERQPPIPPRSFELVEIPSGLM